MKVLDDDGNECPPGVIGEIYMRPSPGSAPTYRYIGSTAKSRDGWDSLGDLGYFDADGFLYLNDRRVDMFTVGGRNVYPAEIESALSADTRTCCPAWSSACPTRISARSRMRSFSADGLDDAAVHRVPRRAHRGLQAAPHGRVHRHAAARRRGQGAAVGGARRRHRATGSDALLTASPCPSGGRCPQSSGGAGSSGLLRRYSQRRNASRHGDSTSA